MFSYSVIKIVRYDNRINEHTRRETIQQTAKKLRWSLSSAPHSLWYYKIHTDMFWKLFRSNMIIKQYLFPGKGLWNMMQTCCEISNLLFIEVITMLLREAYERHRDHIFESPYLASSVGYLSLSHWDIMCRKIILNFFMSLLPSGYEHFLFRFICLFITKNKYVFSINVRLLYM